MNGLLNINDTIFATVRKAGTTVARHTFSGFDSIGAVVKEVCGLNNHISGLVTIELRNSTLGWSDHLNLRL